MKLNISSFGVLLVASLSLLMFLLWCLSLLVLVERQNQQNAEVFQQNWHAQVLQLQQKQQLWLQSQYYLLNTLAESSAESQNFQSFLWDYYQRNSSIWAVNLVQFDEQGLPVSKSSKPGCLQPQQMHREDYKDYLVPRISSCRIDDKALLEISGPVAAGGNAAVLLVSMEYFDFLNEFSSLSGRRLQRATDTTDGIQYQEFSANAGRGKPVIIPIGDQSAVFGQLHLELHSISFWELFKRQAAIVLIILSCGAFLVLVLLHFGLIKPVLELAEKNACCRPEPARGKCRCQDRSRPRVESIKRVLRHITEFGQT